MTGDEPKQGDDFNPPGRFVDWLQWSAVFLGTMFLGSGILVTTVLLMLGVHRDPQWAKTMYSFIPRIILLNLVLFVVPFTIVSAALHRRRLLTGGRCPEYSHGLVPSTYISIAGICVTALPFVIAHGLLLYVRLGLADAIEWKVYPSVWIFTATQIPVIPLFPFAVLLCSWYASSVLLRTRHDDWTQFENSSDSAESDSSIKY